MNCGMSPLDVRRLLEGYCVDREYSSPALLDCEQGSSSCKVQDPSGILPYARAECEAFPPGSRILSIEGDLLEMDAPASMDGRYEAEIVQYKAISDDWIVQTRDCQILPVVKRFTGVSFDGVQRVVEYHSGTGSTVLILNNRPLLELHSVNLITNPENWVYVSPSSCERIPEEGIVKLKAVLESWQNYVPAFPRGTDNIKVEYTYGYDEVPSDIRRAVTMLTAAQALVQMGARGGGGSLGVQGYSKNYGQRGKYTDYIEELEKWAHSLLRNYTMGVLGQ